MFFYFFLCILQISMYLCVCSFSLLFFLVISLFLSKNFVFFSFLLLHCVRCILFCCLQAILDFCLRCFIFFFREGGVMCKDDTKCCPKINSNELYLGGGR